MRAQSLIILIKHFPINMFLTGFPKAALEKQFYLFYEPGPLRDSGVSTFQGLCADTEKSWAQRTTLAKSAWQKPSPVLRQVCSCRRLHVQRPQSRHHAQSITCTCALPLNTLFDRTAGDMSLCLLFQITTEKAVSLSVPSSVGTSQSLVILITGSFIPFQRAHRPHWALSSCPSHDSSVPYPTVFSLTRHVKACFCLLPSIAMYRFVLTSQIILPED